MKETESKIKLRETEKIIFHEETVFLEFNEVGGDSNFHPKPSAKLNENKKLYALQIFKVIGAHLNIYHGILYNDERGSVAAKVIREKNGDSYQDNMEIMSTDYMDEFGRQKAILKADSKHEVIEKALAFARKMLKE